MSRFPPICATTLNCGADAYPERWNKARSWPHSSRPAFMESRILKRDAQPWRTVEGIEFRSITVRAMKGKQGPCWDCNQAVIYRGPWRKVEDDDGHTLVRGQPMAVCEKTFLIYTSEPYAGAIIPVPPLEPAAVENAPPFDCSRDTIRHPRE